MRDPLSDMLRRSTLAVCFLMTVNLARAAVPLSVELDPTTPINRSEGPIPVTLRLQWNGPSVFDGKLLLSLAAPYDGNLVRVETDELFLTQDEQTYSLLLPAYHAGGPMGELELRVICLLDGERHNLPSVRLRGTAADERRVSVLAVGDGERQSGGFSRLSNSLKLESFNPFTGQDRLTTVTQTVLAELFPEDPLLLCPHDVAVVPPGQFEHLSRRQLDALGAWTRAGGSLLLFPEGRSSTLQLEFLNQLSTDADGPNVDFAVDTDGRLVLTESERPRHLRTGLGRVVIAGSETMRTANSNDPRWRRTVAFLWKIQAAHIETLAETGYWDLSVAREAVDARGIDQRWNIGQSADDETLQIIAGRLAPRQISEGSSMLMHLLPEGIRLVPFGLMILLLLLYVAAIGPFDYWFLGLLRQRKFTWILFPALTFAFTGFAVWTSNAFMATQNNRNRLVILDVGDDGRTLKESRFELLFPSRSTTLTTEVPRSLCMPLNHEGLMASGMRYNPNTGTYEASQRGLSGPPLIVGRPPVRTTLVQRIPQWTPQLNRSVSIPLPKDGDSTAPPSEPTFDWNAPVDWSRPASVNGLNQRLQAAFGSFIAAYVYHENERTVLTGPDDYFRDDRHHQQTQVFINGQWSWREVDFLKEMCVRQVPGWFWVVSQTSPGCGPALEDLALLDATDPGMRLLVVAVDEGEDTVLYRKVYREERGQ